MPTADIEMIIKTVTNATKEKPIFERFTERARQVVVMAQEECRARGHDHISTGHLLIGVTEEAEGLGARALENLGATTVSLRRSLARFNPDGKAGVDGQVPFTTGAKEALELSLREALSLGHNYIGTEHLLLALTRERESAASGERVALAMLEDGLITPESLRTEIMRMLVGPEEAKRRKAREEALQSKIERLSGEPTEPTATDELNLAQEAGFLEGFASTLHSGDYDPELLWQELLAMAERLSPDRSQARAALQARAMIRRSES